MVRRRQFGLFLPVASKLSEGENLARGSGLIAREPIVIGARDFLNLLLGHSSWRSKQIHRVNERAVRKSNPIALEGLLVRRPHPRDVLGSCDAVDTARVLNVINTERASLGGTAPGARLLRVLFQPVECARRPVFGLEFDK